MVILFILGWFVVFYLASKLRPSTFVCEIGDLVALILRGIVGMRSPTSPRNSVALRIMFFFYIFTSNIIFLVYKANMTSALAVKSKEKVLTSLEEVLVSDYMVMLPAGSFIKEYLETSKIPIEKAVFENKVLYEEFVFNPKLPSLKSAMKNGVLYVIEKGYVTIDPEYPCSIQLLEEIPTITTPLAFAFPQGSKLKRHFDKEILKLYESGTRYYILNKVLKKNKIGTCSELVQHSTRLEDIFSAFGILVLGFGLSVLIFTLERFTWTADFSQKY